MNWIDMSECIARVNNIPMALPVNAIEELLKHVGATSIRILCGRHKKKAALATFPNASIRDIACTRINKMCLADHKLEATPYESSSEVKPSLQHKQENVEYQPVSGFARRQPTPIAPHLGLHYPPSPFLEYKYPKATTDIVVNIANALMALPKFYTQVLHLMNKMNLPPPFEKDIIRGPFTKSQQETEETKSKQVFQESDDEDDDGDDLISTALNPSSHQQEEIQKDDSALPPAKRHKVLKPAKKAVSSAVPIIFTEPSTCGTLIPRPGVISEAELNRTRLTTEELSQEKHMKNYTQGIPSCVLYVKNIAKSVDESDLRFVFGCVFPSDTDMGLMSIKLFKEGRLKGQAFIEYPNIALATLALQTIHGVCLDNKPLIVVRFIIFNVSFDTYTFSAIVNQHRKSIFILSFYLFISCDLLYNNTRSESSLEFSYLCIMEGHFSSKRSFQRYARRWHFSMSSIEELQLLQRAARKGRHDLVASLIMNGADMNAIDEAGRTSAHQAARNGHVQVLEVLHALGADLNRVSYRGVSVAHQAAYSGHLKFIEKLVACGAHVDLTDGNDRTPLEVALEAQQWHVVEYLEKIYSQKYVEIDDQEVIDTELQAPAFLLHEKDTGISAEEMNLSSQSLHALIPMELYEKSPRKHKRKRGDELSENLLVKRILSDELPSTPIDKTGLLSPPHSSPPSLCNKQMTSSLSWRRKPDFWSEESCENEGLLLQSSVVDLIPMDPESMTLPAPDCEISVQALLDESFD
ncbi:hypothetical protein THRCLA_09115 [Thraustotheca clavata]|uniref:RRM domain-containing protein n=1 Tax=Thraustotheca clavata TaxID=74557 RepID=A0A1V9YZB5_9STRA|nr:hypothetical protein THRCLA_09115 [Thraustotheca clavata]